MELNWQTLAFYDLTHDQLYAIMMLRQEVFVVEQTCPYLDADGYDQTALHLLGTNKDGKLMAYARLFRSGQAYPQYASIGRVVTAPAVRGQGLGYQLMDQALLELIANFGPTPVKISAQAHLQDFYSKLGFVSVGEGYLEDDIPHWAMVKK
ncbi:MAG: GNAT family N-acetyltransferase [Bacteroidota bacterium]